MMCYRLLEKLGDSVTGEAFEVVIKKRYRDDTSFLR
ncbi:hypothetical protein ICG_00978 [Bacillus cereus BAG1X1-3]|nr:hypothetical protein ICG_00978 [Bacillus cereus BAG1X1-3]EOO71593.1 hypothetical protein IC7_03876 [Bacillus cereus BAG1O-1]